MSWSSVRALVAWTWPMKYRNAQIVSHSVITNIQNRKPYSLKMSICDRTLKVLRKLVPPLPMAQLKLTLLYFIAPATSTHFHFWASIVALLSKITTCNHYSNIASISITRQWHWSDCPFMFAHLRCSTYRFDLWWNFWADKNHGQLRLKCSKTPNKRWQDVGPEVIKNDKRIWWELIR